MNEMYDFIMILLLKMLLLNYIMREMCWGDGWVHYCLRAQ